MVTWTMHIEKDQLSLLLRERGERSHSDTFSQITNVCLFVLLLFYSLFLLSLGQAVIEKENLISIYLRY